MDTVKDCLSGSDTHIGTVVSYGHLQLDLPGSSNDSDPLPTQTHTPTHSYSHAYVNQMSHRIIYEAFIFLFF